MVICIFGESCTGKSTLADRIKKQTGATIYTGKDYLKLAKNESEAKQKFTSLLTEKSQEKDVIIYVVTESELLSLLPANTYRILVTADLDVIKERFSKRMGGHMPAPIASMLERKHGSFDSLPHDLKVTTETLEEDYEKILELVSR